MSGYSRRGREAERGPASVTRRSVWLHKVYPLSARLVTDRPAFGPLAQMEEHRHHTPRVAGSSPARSTMRSLSGCKTRRGMSTGHQPGVRVRFPPQSATCSRATMVKSVRWGLIAPVASWICCRQGYSSAAICSMRTNGTCGCDSHCPAYGLLAQWTERLVTSQDVAGSSPARPTGGTVFSTLLGCATCCGVCHGVGARC